jgi:hypothetical protein
LRTNEVSDLKECQQCQQLTLNKQNVEIVLGVEVSYIVPEMIETA